MTRRYVLYKNQNPRGRLGHKCGKQRRKPERILERASFFLLLVSKYCSTIFPFESYHFLTRIPQETSSRHCSKTRTSSIIQNLFVWFRVGSSTLTLLQKVPFLFMCHIHSQYCSISFGRFAQFQCAHVSRGRRDASAYNHSGRRRILPFLPFPAAFPRIPSPNWTLFPQLFLFPISISSRSFAPHFIKLAACA